MDSKNGRSLKILSPIRYPWTFNGPRHSRNRIFRRSFVPVSKISPKYEGVTFIASYPWEKIDLIHAFNRIPLNGRPFIVGFESHLPRAFDLEYTRYYGALRRTLASEKCKRIVAISEHARDVFLQSHDGSKELGEMVGKLEMRYPNIAIPPLLDGEVDERIDAGQSEVLKIVFIGNHFARKGGCVAARVAEIAHNRGLPVEVTIVSALEVGGQIWTDPLRTAFFDRYFKLLDLPNVKFHRGLPNGGVHALLKSADFSLLTTFCDTFGYSVIESLANATPVIATRQGALPEFLRHMDNAIMLDLEINEFGYWKYSSSNERDTGKFEALFEGEVERLAHETCVFLEQLIGDRGKRLQMREAARLTAETHFDSVRASRYWDDLYDRVTS